MAKRTPEIKVVPKALPTSRGATGAPGSVPAAISPVSCCKRSPTGSTANRTVNQMVKKTAPAAAIEKMHVWLQPFAAIFVRQSVRVRAPPLLPFGHAALKTGSAVPRPIAGKSPRADYHRKIVSTI